MPYIYISTSLKVENKKKFLEEISLLMSNLTKKSKRFVIGSTPNLSQTKIKKTGVFVNAEFEKIKNKVLVHKLKAIQLHGLESPEFCEKIKGLGVEIIKAFSVDENFSFNIQFRVR